MKIGNRLVSLALCCATVLSLAGCSIPRPGFADYDVSRYVKALLDSSYHDDSAELISISGVSAAEAADNNIATVENAAVRFCNTYGVYPNEAQFTELQLIMKQAFALTRYTVKDERKVDTGYYLEVEVASITNFENRQSDISRLKAEAESEAAQANSPQQPAPASDAVSHDEDEEDEGYDEYDEYEDEDEEKTEPTPSPEPAAPAEKVSADELFVEKVLEFCQRELANISYDPDSITIALDVLQTDEGELQLDLDQIETIDETVIRID